LQICKLFYLRNSVAGTAEDKNPKVWFLRQNVFLKQKKFFGKAASTSIIKWNLRMFLKIRVF